MPPLHAFYFLSSKGPCTNPLSLSLLVRWEFPVIWNASIPFHPRIQENWPSSMLFHSRNSIHIIGFSFYSLNTLISPSRNPTLLKWPTIIFEAPPKRSVSSMNYEWLNSFIFLAMLTPTNQPSILSSSKFLLKITVTMIYNNGERGHPYLRALEAVKKLEGIPLIRGVI